MKIKNIEINRLYDRYGFVWEMRDDVNILAGDNGSYKSTLLRIITEMCEVKEQPIKPYVMSACMEMSNGFKLINRKVRESARSMGDGLIVSRDGRIVSPEDFRNECKYDSVVTFDVPSSKEGASALDGQLEKLESDYAYYLSDLSKQLQDMIRRKGNVDKDDLEKIYAQNNLFISIIDEAFRNTGKSVDKEQSRLQFILDRKQFPLDKRQLMDNKKLSSGEKQYIVLMLTVLLQRCQESILIMDEPEVSMHVDWQRGLIGNIRRLNPNVQVILATHSPGVVMDGWEQMITNVSDIMKVQE